MSSPDGLTTVSISEADLTAFMGAARRDGDRLKGDPGSGRLGRVPVIGVLHGFKPLEIAKRFKKLEYTRLEYIDFLVKEARNESNSVEFRRECYRAVDRLCVMVGAAHPRVAQEMLHVKRLNGPGKRKYKRDRRFGKVVRVEKAAVSPFVAQQG